MKMILLRHVELGPLQREINDWLENNPRIKIEHVKQTETIESVFGAYNQETSIYITISIWYTEIE
ncbi:hypothetical protein KAR91_04035 [Candidatus Pacearchaeota archaeon]|nr:hypothetical protein [Candidatus Pacearchaeota archaeon]